MFFELSNIAPLPGAPDAKHVCVLIKDGVVASAGSEPSRPPGARHIDLNGGLLTPGLIDLQVNGGGGVLLNNDPTPDGVARIVAAHRRLGTAGLLATIITDSREIRRAAALSICAQLRAGLPGLLGVHFEGPFINPAKAGVHALRHIVRPDADAVAELADLAAAVRAAGGAALITVAPEMFEPRVLSALAAQGVVLAAGHSAATYEQAMIGFNAGVSGVTHLFNAMSGLESRAPGLVGAALDRPDVWCGIIADGFHVHPAALRLALRAKGPDKLALVSDSMACTGADNSAASAARSFDLYGQTIRRDGGRLVDADGRLAGADISLADAVRNMAARFGFDRNQGGDALSAALRMATVAPAAALGLPLRAAITPGAPANLTWLDADLSPRGVWSAGNFCPCDALPLA